MKPIEFPEMTGTAAKDQPEYQPLPMYRGDGWVISCWKMTRWERIKVLFTGRVWLWLRDFGGPITPSTVTQRSPFEKVDAEHVESLF